VSSVRFAVRLVVVEDDDVIVPVHRVLVMDGISPKLNDPLIPAVHAPVDE
jgi:hypothetical protein